MPRALLARLLGPRLHLGLVAAVLVGGPLALPRAALASGILAPTDRALPPLRITDHLVSTSIRDGVAVTKLTQVFHNDTGQRLEATYVFPLPEQADLTDFRMSFNGKMVEGEVLPAKEAAAIYESIVRQARDPGIIEFIGRRLLRMRVFPIEPESDTTIALRYHQVCRPLSGMTGYHYPLRTNQTSGTAHGTVRFAVELETTRPLKAIWSPTHAVEIVRGADEHSARIAYEASGGSLEEDFMLLYDTDGGDVGLSAVAYKPSDEAGHGVLMLTPKQLWPEESYEPQDVVFVTDTSGSMAGEKLEQAQAALKYSIDRLDERDRFSVVRFSTGFDALFDPLTSADAIAREKAKTWIDGFSAAGGTNIADTLAHVLGMLSDRAERETRPFVVVFLTDGRGNREPEEVIKALDAAAQANAVAHDKIRFFPFGVGHDVNTHLLDRLPENWTGRTTYVQPGENLELVLGDFFSVVSRPVLTNLKLTLPDIGASELFPVTLGDLYHGQQLVIATQFEREMSGPVKLTATRAGERVEFVWPNVAFRHAEDAVAVPSVWAGRKIAYLLDQVRRHGESQEMVDEILALGMKHGIQTPYSSWLVNPEGVPTQVLRRGWAAGSGVGGFGASGGAPGASSFHVAPGRRAPSTAATEHLGRVVTGGVFGDPDDSPARIEDLALFAGLDEEAIDRGLADASGEVAVILARKNAQMKSLRSRDESRMSREFLAWRDIGGCGYNRVGRFLVDDRLGERTALTVIAFASDAYFELVRARPDLRAALAASPDVVVMLVVPAASDPGDDATNEDGEHGAAVVVSTRGGESEFSVDQREELGLPPR